MKRRLIVSFTILSTLSGCAGFSTDRNFLSDSGEDGSSFFQPRSDFPVMAGDSGKFGESEEELRSRAPKTLEEMDREKTTMVLERELAQLEDAQSESNAELYQLHKSKFQSTSEKIFYLKLPKSERHSYLVSKGMIKEQKYQFTDRMKNLAIKQSDVMLGMNKSDVMTSWGRPTRVEVAGNPSYENERWAYHVNGATKYIYFEGGKVEGWE